jgi:hypothetical protein
MDPDPEAQKAPTEKGGKQETGEFQFYQLTRPRSIFTKKLTTGYHQRIHQKGWIQIINNLAYILSHEEAWIRITGI